MGSIDWSGIAQKLIPYIPTFETRIVGLLIIIVSLISLNVWAYRQRKQSPKGSYNWLRITNVTLFTVSLGIIGSIFFVRPIVIRTSPSSGSTLTSAHQEIEVEFDIPVDPDEVVFNISPEIEGEWEFEPTISAIPLTRKAVFHPTESFYPGNPVVVYITGIKTLSKAGKMHEKAIEFNAPAVPELESIYPANDSTNVRTDENIVLSYDSPTGEFVETTITITPNITFSLTSDGTNQTIQFPDGLSQDTTYELSIFQTPRSYDTATGESITVGETLEIGSTTFSTVTTPGIATITPNGTGALPSSPLTVVFDKEMLPNSVEEHFSLSPDIEGEITWEDEYTFVFTPSIPFEKETTYTVTFSKGILSADKGRTEEDAVISFTTVGRVKIAAISPLSGSYGSDPISTNISITFDQEVDHQSAQNHFSIIPSVAGNFSWSGNTLTYHTAGNLAYSTNYTITLTPGIKSMYGLDSTETYSYSFTTRDNTFALNIPLYLQAPGFTCNLVATKMALGYRGVSVDINAILSWIGYGGDPNTSWVDGYGTHWGPISSYIRQYRSTTARQGWTLTEILQEVENGNPVILFWYNRYSQPKGAFTLPSGVTGYMGMHSEVVRGFVGTPENPSAILTNDPWRGRLSYSPSLFMSTWAYINNAAVVVY